MRHARDDYQRIQDPAGKIPDDEPVFLLRGQDHAAAHAVRYYADILEAWNADPEIIRKAREHADRMEAWPTKKIPDLPAGIDRDRLRGKIEADPDGAEVEARPADLRGLADREAGR